MPDLAAESIRDEFHCWELHDSYRLSQRDCWPEMYGCDVGYSVKPDPRLGGRVGRFKEALSGVFGNRMRGITPLSYDSFADPVAAGCADDARSIARFRQMTYLGLCYPDIVARIGMRTAYSRMCDSEVLQADYRRWYEKTVDLFHLAYDKHESFLGKPMFAEYDQSAHVTRGYHLAVVDCSEAVPSVVCMENLVERGVIDPEPLYLTERQMATVAARMEVGHARRVALASGVERIGSNDRSADGGSHMSR